jgi:hypothetical protein
MEHTDSLIPKEIVFSENFVESKRCRRTLGAVINNVRPADAIRQGLVEEGHAGQAAEAEDDGEGLFIPESKAAPRRFGTGAFNPEVPVFKLSGSFGSTPLPTNSIFGRPSSASPEPNPLFSSAHQPSTQTGTSQFGGFADQTATGQGTTPPLSRKFGEGFASAATAAPSTTGPSSGLSLFAPTSGNTDSTPGWMTSFGQQRPSLEDRPNPFGPRQTTASTLPESTPSQAENPLGGFTQSQPANVTGFNFSGASASTQGQAAPKIDFSFPKPSTSQLGQAQPSPAGFYFAKTEPLAASSTPQSTATGFAFTSTSSSTLQGSPAAFSFTSQSQPTGKHRCELDARERQLTLCSSSTTTCPHRRDLKLPTSCFCTAQDRPLSISKSGFGYSTRSVVHRIR